MSVLQKIGAFVRSAFGQSTPPALDKTEILSNVENLFQFGQIIGNSFGHLFATDTFDVLRQVGVRDLTPEGKMLQKLYDTYFQALPSKWQQAERTQILSTLKIVVDAITEDLNTIQTQFPTLFQGVDTADIPLSDATISTASMLGWLENVSRYFSWVMYFIGQVSPGGGERLPPYQMVWLRNNLDDFIAMSLSILSRPRGESIVTVLTELRRKGGDLALSVDGQTIDSYASDNQYAPEIVAALHGFSANPRRVIRAAGNQINQIRQWRYERMKAQREWLSSKVGYLVLQSQGLDPDSAEAKRLRMIIAKYGEIVAQLDKKLGSVDE